MRHPEESEVLDARTGLLDLKRRLGEKEMQCLTLEYRSFAKARARKQILMFFSEWCIIHFHVLFLSTITV